MNRNAFHSAIAPSAPAKKLTAKETRNLFEALYAEQNDRDELAAKLGMARSDLDFASNAFYDGKITTTEFKEAQYAVGLFEKAVASAQARVTALRNKINA